MYLNRLSNEQKELFLDLSIHASNSNNDFDEAQKEYIWQYCEEMQISPVRYEAKCGLEEAADKLIETSSRQELKIIALELMALILSDNNYDEMERKFMEKILDKAGMTDAVHKRIVDLLNELNGIYGKINEFIFD